MPNTSRTQHFADSIPNRFLTASDWSDPRYRALREEFNALYRDELGGTPHPTHARFPDSIVTHWSREWEYPWAVLNSEAEPGMRVVDLGCGGSPLLPYMVWRLGCRATGVDLNLLSAGRQTLRGFPRDPAQIVPEADWVIASMAQTGLPDGSFDRVVCISVLEHVGEDVAVATLREMRRLLAPGGRVLITTDVDGAHRTLATHYTRLIELAGEPGLRLRGNADFTPPADRDAHPGTYDVVGMVFETA